MIVHVYSFQGWEFVGKCYPRKPRTLVPHEQWLFHSNMSYDIIPLHNSGYIRKRTTSGWSLLILKTNQSLWKSLSQMHIKVTYYNMYKITVKNLHWFFICKIAPKLHCIVFIVLNSSKFLLISQISWFQIAFWMKMKHTFLNVCKWYQKYIENSIYCIVNLYRGLEYRTTLFYIRLEWIYSVSLYIFT